MGQVPDSNRKLLLLRFYYDISHDKGTTGLIIPHFSGTGKCHDPARGRH